jgi:hypothetical protein
MNNVIDNKQEEPDNLKTVEFHLVKSLPDPNPTIVKREHRICLQY